MTDINEKLAIIACLNLTLLLLFFNMCRRSYIAPIRANASQTMALGMLPSFNILIKFEINDTEGSFIIKPKVMQAEVLTFQKLSRKSSYKRFYNCL